jgi:phosphatidylglycerol---prolipoprotein diacylglyceryl transferase
MIPYHVYDIINLGFIEISIWGLFVSLGFLLAILFLFFEARKKKFDINILPDLALGALISSFLGARILYVFNDFSYFFHNPIDIFKIWEGGLAWYGGVAGAIIFGYFYTRKKKISFWQLTDSVAPALALGEFVGRIGCFMVHDHLGRLTNVPWAINYYGEMRHETAMYSSLLGFLLFVFLLLIRKVKKFQKPGYISSFYMILYGAITFFIYGLRSVDLPFSDPFWGPLRPSQYFSLLLLILGIITLIKIAKRDRIQKKTI